MSTLEQLNAEVVKWKNSLRKATTEERSAYMEIYGYECGHPVSKEEYDRLKVAEYHVKLIRKKLAEAQGALKAFNDAIEQEKAKAYYEKMWINEPTLQQAYNKR
jgi:hypothetical protein